jgi:hypothetical protein
MCGIVAVCGNANSPAMAMDIVKEQADRGKDATGIAWSINNKIVVLKGALSPDEFIKKYNLRISRIKSMTAIAHNRAATTNIIEKEKDKESHPFLSEDGTFVLLQNGGVVNFEYMRAFLENVGHTFSTGIDSEVLLHLYEEIVASNPDRKTAIEKFSPLVQGNILIMFNDGEIYGFPSNGAFSVIRTQSSWIIASEVKAILHALKAKNITPEDFWSVTDKSGYVLLKENDAKINATFFGEWDNQTLREGTWIYNRKIMCDFCGKSQVACEEIMIDKIAKDRCIECFRKGTTTLRYDQRVDLEDGWQAGVNGGVGYGGYKRNIPTATCTHNNQKALPSTIGSSKQARLDLTAICYECQLPTERLDIVFCIKCGHYFCKYDFSKHKCSEKHDKESMKFDIFNFLSMVGDANLGIEE